MLPRNRRNAALLLLILIFGFIVAINLVQQGEVLFFLRASAAEDIPVILSETERVRILEQYAERIARPLSIRQNAMVTAYCEVRGQAVSGPNPQDAYRILKFLETDQGQGLFDNVPDQYRQPFLDRLYELDTTRGIQAAVVKVSTDMAEKTAAADALVSKAKGRTPADVVSRGSTAKSKVLARQAAVGEEQPLRTRGSGRPAPTGSGETVKASSSSATTHVSKKSRVITRADELFPNLPRKKPAVEVPVSGPAEDDSSKPWSLPRLQTWHLLVLIALTLGTTAYLVYLGWQMYEQAQLEAALMDRRLDLLVHRHERQQEGSWTELEEYRAQAVLGRSHVLDSDSKED